MYVGIKIKRTTMNDYGKVTIGKKKMLDKRRPDQHETLVERKYPAR